MPEPNYDYLQKWYKEFSALLLKNAHIDVNTPQELGLVKNFEITNWSNANITAPDVDITYAYAPPVGAGSVPYSKDADRRKHEEWLNKNLKPAVTEDQIRRLYNMSLAGTLMITPPNKSLKDIQMVHTKPDGKIILTQPISAYRDGGNENFPVEDRIPEMPKPVFSPNPEDYGIRPRPEMPQKPANMHPGFWSWLGYILGMDTDYTKLKRYERKLEAYYEEVHQWDADLNDKASYDESIGENGETKHVGYDEFRRAHVEHARLARQQENIKSNPMVKFSAIANTAAKLANEHFWNSEKLSLYTTFKSTPRGAALDVLFNTNEMLDCEKRTDIWLHNWLGHDAVPSRTREFFDFRLDNFQVKPLELPKNPNFNRMNPASQAAHSGDMSDIFDFAALSALVHPDITGKVPADGITNVATARNIFGTMFHSLFTRGRPNPTEFFKYIEPAREKAMAAMVSYSGGNKEPLAELLGSGMRQLLREGNKLQTFADHSINTAYLIVKMYKTMQKDDELLKAVNLNYDEMKLVNVHMELYKFMRQGYQAKKEILDHAWGNHTLAPEKLKQAVQELLISHSVQIGMDDACKKNEDALHASKTYKALEAKFIVPIDKNDPKKGTKMADAATFERIKNQLNALDSGNATNKFTLQLLNKDWVKQYTQAFIAKADLSKIGDMNHAQLRDLFSATNDKIFSALIPASSLNVQEQNSKKLQAEKKENAPANVQNEVKQLGKA